MRTAEPKSQKEEFPRDLQIPMAADAEHLSTHSQPKKTKFGVQSPPGSLHGESPSLSAGTLKNQGELAVGLREPKAHIHTLLFLTG